MTSPDVFSFFQNFDFLGVSGVKGQKMAQNDKKILSVMVHISGTIHHMIVICGTQVWNNNSAFRSFFYFFKILIFGIDRRLKGQKMAQNDKQLCPSCLTSQEPYITWSSFMLHIRKRIISPSFFTFFPNLIFRVNSGVKRAKNDKKIMSVTLHIAGSIDHMIAIFHTHL